jgi:hypothetical protein
MFFLERINCFKQLLRTCLLFVLISLLVQETALSQRDFFQPSTNYNSSRVTGIAIGESVLATATTLWLNFLWYKKFPRSKFHLFNDNNEWLNMDKLGHATTAYNIAAIQSDILHWAGVKSTPSSLIGTFTALGFMTMIEIMDGHSEKWGFSEGDMLANISGSILFEGQQLMWGQQRFGLKYSYHRTIFPRYNPNELGENGPQRMLKDYNGQSYWLSLNVASFLPANTKFPRWFNVAAGYGAEGMVNAVTNPAEVDGKKVPSFTRYRQFYLSADADLYRINNLSPFATTVLKLNRTVKMPSPTLEWNKVEGLKFHPLYY